MNHCQLVCFFLLALFIQEHHFKSIPGIAEDPIPKVKEGCLGNFVQNNGCDYEALIAHPIDCNKFLQCSNGYEYILPCPKSLVFNFEKQQCDYLHNVARCWNLHPTTSTSTVTTTITPSTTTSTSSQTTTQMDSTSTTSQTSLVTTTTHTTSTSTTTVTTTTSTTTTTPVTTTTTVTTSTSTTTTTPVTTTTTVTTSTSTTTTTTVTTTITTSTSTATENKYPCSPGEVFPNPNDLSTFIECRLRSCPKGMIFDSVRSQCIFPGCKKLQSDHVVLCGGFEGVKFPRLGSRKMVSESCNDFKRCVMYSRNPEDVELCTFSCDDSGKETPDFDFRLVFSMETQSCEIPPYIDVPCGAK